MHTLAILAISFGRLLFGHAFLFQKLFYAALTIALWELYKKIYWPNIFAAIRYATTIIVNRLYNYISRVMEIGEVTDFKN